MRAVDPGFDSMASPIRDPSLVVLGSDILALVLDDLVGALGPAKNSLKLCSID